MAGGSEPHRGPQFAAAVPNRGYAWWYVDALSDDHEHALTLIAFVGSVFSPYYAWARRRGRGDPENFTALNVALYGRGGKRWAMTERGHEGLRRNARELAVGPSRVAWDGSALTIEIDEVCVPFPSRIKGRVRLHPAALVSESFALDAAGLHRWQPIAPVSRVEVELDKPGLRWQGSGYFDTNWGDVPLEESFVRWDWSRTEGHNSARMHYDVTRRPGDDMALAIEINAKGNVRHIDLAPRARLPRTLWQVERSTRSHATYKPKVIATLEDTPFYARSLIDMSFDGTPATAMHESLSLDRFANPIVQLMLPFRMPRRRR